MCYFRLDLACAKALAATDLVFAGVLGLLNRAEAFLATAALVTRLLLDFAIVFLSLLAAVNARSPNPWLPHRALIDQLEALAGSQKA